MRAFTDFTNTALGSPPPQHKTFIGLVGTVAIILTVELFYKFARCYVDFVVLDHDIISVKLLNRSNAH